MGAVGFGEDSATSSEVIDVESARLHGYCVTAMGDAGSAADEAFGLRKKLKGDFSYLLTMKPATKV